MSISLPRLRLVEIYPIQSNGTKVFCLRDPDGYQEDPVFLSPEACLVAVMLDGNSGIEDIQAVFSQHFQGQKIEEKEIRQVIETLEECFLLDTERFARQKAILDAAFRASRVREPYLSGRGYPKEGTALGEFLDKFYLDSKGPGQAPGARKAGIKLAGLVAPHIDFHRGGWCYAHAYKALAEAEVPERIILLGVAHAGAPAPFVFCAKSFKTPSAELPLDAEGIEELRSRLGQEAFEHEALHRTEHSLEFQAVWLGHLYRGAAVKPKIIPALVSSFGCERPGDSPKSVEAVEKTIEALSDFCLDPGTLVLAGVDFAHVGPRFGDKVPLDEALANRTRGQDEASLTAAASGNAQNFWNSVVHDGNQRKVCGLSALYTALRLLRGRKGKVLSYGQALDPAGGIVSFASLSYPA